MNGSRSTSRLRLEAVGASAGGYQKLREFALGYGWRDSTGLRAARGGADGASVRRADPEHHAQCEVVALLRASGLVFASSLNGVRLSRTQAGKASRAGMEAGEPDLCIYDPPPNMPECVGMMIEMKLAKARPKTARAHRWSGATAHQRDRMALLEARGWWCVVGYGAAGAIDELKAAGYALAGDV